MSADPRPGDPAPGDIVCERCRSDRVVVGTVVGDFIYYRCETCLDVWPHRRSQFREWAELGRD